MKKKKRKYWLVILIIVLLIIVVLGGLLYWKVERIVHSISDSAQKANSQNTPLED
jgi:uncharacterized protein YpmB